MYPSYSMLSKRTPGPPGTTSFDTTPGLGMKFLAAFSALMRTSMAAPVRRMSSCFNRNGWPSAMRSISFTRSMPVIISVTGCSTWMRVFISMKKNSRVSSS